MKPSKRRMRITALIVLVCTLAGLFCLSATSFALTGGYMCGYDEEHTHTEDCYENVLICGKEEHAPTCGIMEEHLHDLSCCQEGRVLVCSLPEHIHNQFCYDEYGQLICIMDEHIHDEYCYATEPVLACTKQEHMHSEACQPLDENGNRLEVHVHTSECWQRQCTCGKREHKHDPILCMFASFEGVENEIMWESTIPFEKLEGDWNKDVLTVAESQIGYYENMYNSVLAEDGKTRLGYTRYGHWFGYPYGDWCAMFGAFCLNYAGVPKDAVPYAAGVETWMRQLSERNMLEDVVFYEPKPGDLVFIADDGVRPNHMGIVYSFTSDKQADSANVSSYSATSGKMEIIQGNKEDAVKIVEISLPHKTVVGYVDLVRAKDQWLGVHSTELRCGDDVIELKYLSSSGVDGYEDFDSKRSFSGTENYEEARKYALAYMKRLNANPEKLTIKLYEITAMKNGRKTDVPVPDEVRFVSGASGLPVLASFEVGGKTFIMICR